jgi:Ca2+-binding EF-hand superfamily protein
MSSSVGNSSLVNLALLNQLLQRANGETTDTNATADSQATDESGSSTSFSSQADALINALDTDGDGKLSKAELQTGFQKLSQDMRSFLIGQQNIGDNAGADSLAASAVSSLDSDGDGELSESELETALTSSGTTASDASPQNNILGTNATWDSWMQQMQGSQIGDVANQAATSSLQQSTKMDNALTQLLQTIESYQNNASGTTGTV